ncbi:MAG: PAS domain-containing protein [Archaeoglobaceae archaeon]
MANFDLDRILENVPVPTFVIDKEHRVKYWNKACEELTNYRKEDIIGTTDHWKPFFSRKKPLLADIVLDGVEEFYRNKKVKKRKIKKVRDREDTYEMELFLPHFGKWVYFRASLLRSNGDIIGAIETMEDISERKLMEELVKAAEQEKGVVLDNMREVVIFQDLNHRVWLANRAAGEAVNMNPDAMVGNSCHEVWFNRSEPCKNCPIEVALDKGQPQEGEMISPDGRIWLVRGYPVKGENDKIEGVVEVGLDITDSKKAEMEIERQREFLQRIIDSIPDFVVFKDREQTYRLVNKAFCDFIGKDWQEIIGKTDFEIFPPEEAEMFQRDDSRLMDTGQTQVQDEEVTGKGGKQWLQVAKTPVYDHSGNVTGILCSVRDVTERKLMEELVKAAEQEKGAVLDSMNEIVMFQNNDHRIMLANRAAGEAVSMDSGALVGKYCYEVWFGKEEPCENCPVERAYKTGYPQEAEIRANGKVWFIRGYPVKDEEGNIGGVVEVGLDMTDRKLMEENLTRLNQLLRISSEINDLIVKEKEKEELLRKACRTLASFDGVITVWIGLLEDDRVRPVEVVGKTSKEELEDALSSGAYCTRKAISRKRPVLKWSNEMCEGCSIRAKHIEHQSFIIPIPHGDKLYGIIGFCSSKDIFGEEERSKMKELSEDLGFALWSIEIEQERKEAIDHITKNLEHFELLADKLRNPLAIAKGCLELEDEIGTRETLRIIADQMDRLHIILNDLRRRETITFQLKEKLE